MRNLFEDEILRIWHGFSTENRETEQQVDQQRPDQCMNQYFNEGIFRF